MEQLAIYTSSLHSHIFRPYTFYLLPTEPSSSGSVGGIAAAIVILVVALLIIGAVIVIVVR